MKCKEVFSLSRTFGKYVTCEEIRYVMTNNCKVKAHILEGFPMSIYTIIYDIYSFKKNGKKT